MSGLSCSLLQPRHLVYFPTGLVKTSSFNASGSSIYTAGFATFPGLIRSNNHISISLYQWAFKHPIQQPTITFATILEPFHLYSTPQLYRLESILDIYPQPTLDISASDIKDTQTPFHPQIPKAATMCMRVVERYSVCKCVYFIHGIDQCSAYGRRSHEVEDRVVLVGHTCPDHSSHGYQYSEYSGLQAYANGVIPDHNSGYSANSSGSSSGNYSSYYSGH